MSDKTPITVTLKYGGGKMEPWVIFNGDAASIRRDLYDYFAMPPSHFDNLPLNEVVMSAARIAVGETTITSIVGGNVVSVETEGVTDQTSTNWPSRDTEDDVWAEAQAKADDPVARVKKEFAGATTIDRLKRVWIDNKAICTEHEELREAYAARGEEIKAGK